MRKKAKIIAKKQTNEFDREKLLAIQGQELKYNKLCQALDVPTKVGNAKISQIDDLGMYCRLEQLSGPTRYVVQEVYDGALLAELNGNNKYQ